MTDDSPATAMLTPASSRPSSATHPDTRPRSVFGVDPGAQLGGHEPSPAFRVISNINHSCVPNVTLLKEAESAEERDGRVVARTTRDVAEGEELCNAYVDVSLPLRRRRRELREYGFECDCPRCVQELAVAAEKKAADKKSGKKRLK